MVDGMMQSAVVIDIVSNSIYLKRTLQGSGMMKAGLSGEEKPSLTFNT
jgi:hypothetical protein